MSNIDDDFAKQDADVRQSYFVKALNWYINNRKGQPSLPVVKRLAATLWFTDEFVSPCKRKQLDENRD